MEYDELQSKAEELPTQAGGEEGTRGLTLRERFRRCMFFQEVDRIPNFEFGYWERTIKAWHNQGLPEDVTDEKSAYAYFGIENWAVAPSPVGPLPVHKKEKVLEETDDYVTTRDCFGAVRQENKRGDKSIPHFLEYPVKDRASWEKFKPALDPGREERWKGIEKRLAKLCDVTVPLGVSGGSLVGIPRNLIGFQNIAMMVYEDPDLLKEIVDTFGELIVTVLDRVLPRVQADFAMGWEDICFNQGPILPPVFFRDVVGPWNRRIADVLNSHGCCVYATDCDGNINAIAGIWVENGLNTMFPVEVHAGTDPCALRDRFGKRVRLWGGVDKMKLTDSTEAIDRELARLRPYVEQGGFIPGVDHRVQADVPLDHYKHYLDRKRALFNTGGEPKY